MSASISKNTPEEPLGVLHSLSPFKGFSEEELLEIAPLCEIRKVPAGTTILREGDPSDNKVFFLLSGGVSVYMGENFILALQRSGDIFGETSLISDEPRGATVISDTPLSLLVVDSTLKFAPGQSGEYRYRYYFAHMFSAILTDKLRMTSQRAEMHDEAVEQTLEARRQSSSLEAEIRRNLDQIRVYSHLMESATDAVLILNISGVILEANPSVQKIFGHVPAELVGSCIDTLLILPASGPLSWKAIVAAAKRGWSGDVQVRNGAEELIPADCAISLVQTSNEEALAYSVILRDLRERKAYEARILAQSRELAKANEELKTLDTLKGRFMSLVSHQLRTPLSSIIAYSEVLTMEGRVEPDERQEFLDTIQKEAKQLGHLIHKVLSILKMESGQMLFDFAEGQLDEIVRYAGMSNKNAAADKRLRLEVDIQKEFMPTCFDSDKLQEALCQLLDNALKFTETGGITISALQEEEQSLIRIADSGCGMEAGALSGAFDKFNWMHTIETHQHDIGLGLPLAHLIVTAHAGRMEMQSTRGEGTIVSIWLPHQPAQNAP